MTELYYLKCQQKSYETYKETGNHTREEESRHWKTAAEGVQMVDFADKDFTPAGKNMFKELKETVLKG